jgi:hypothetical protein
MSKQPASRSEGRIAWRRLAGLRTIAALAVALVAAAAFAVRSARSDGGLRSTSEHDAGVAPVSSTELSRVQHVWEIPNCYNRPLRLKLRQASCGCTKAALDREVLAPGESARFELMMEVANENRDRMVQAVVETDSDEFPTLTFILRWQARARIATELNRAPHLSVEPGTTSKSILTFTCRQPATESPQQVRVTTQGNRIAARVAAVTELDTEDDLHVRHVDVEVTIRWPETGYEGNQPAWVEAHCGPDKFAQAVCIAPVYAVKAIPGSLFLRRDAAGLAGELQLMSDSAFRVLGARVEGTNTAFVPEFAGEAQSRHRVRMSVPSAEAPKSTLEGMLLIETDHPRRPLVRVPLYALASRAVQTGE